MKIKAGLLLLIAIAGLYAQSPSVDPSQTVNPATGEMVLSIPLASVQDGTGRTFPISLGYKAGIRTNQSSSPVGLGFDVPTGSISRKVVMVPDDETNAYKNDPGPNPDCTDNPHSHCELVRWKNILSWVLRIIGFIIAVIVLIIVIVTGNVEAVPAPLALLSFAVSGAGIVLSLVVFEPANYVAGGHHLPNYFYPGCNDGYFVGNGNEFDLPDLYFLSTPYMSGELLYLGGNPDGSHAFVLKNSSSPEAVKIRYENDEFLVTLPDGTRLFFESSGKSKQKTYGKAYIKADDADCNYDFTVGGDWVTSNWNLTKVLFNNFTGDENSPSAHNAGGWVTIEYLNVAHSGSHFWVQSDNFQMDERTAGNTAVYYQSLSYPKTVKMHLQRAEYVYAYNRLDNPLKCAFDNDLPLLLPRLEELKVYSKENRVVRRIEFDNGYDQRPNTIGAAATVTGSYYIPNGSGGVTKVSGSVPGNSNKASLTLNAIWEYSSVPTETPFVTVFTYDAARNFSLNRIEVNCPEGNDETDGPNRSKYIIEQRDLWGFFSDDGINGNVFNVSGNRANVLKSDAWSLREMLMPSGMRVQWEYEPNRYDRANNVPVSSGSAQPKYGGGVRVKKMTVHDGLGSSHAYSYFYQDMSTPGVFTETATNSSGHATVEPFPYLLKEENDPRPKLARGGFYTGAKVAYERTVVVKNYNPASSPHAPTGYTVYDFITSKNAPNHGEYGQNDESWRRGMIQAISSYNAQNVRVSKIEKEYTYKPDLRIYDDYEWKYSRVNFGICRLTSETTMRDGVSSKREYEYADEITGAGSDKISISEEFPLSFPINELVLVNRQDCEFYHRDSYFKGGTTSFLGGAEPDIFAVMWQDYTLLYEPDYFEYPESQWRQMSIYILSDAADKAICLAEIPLTDLVLQHDLWGPQTMKLEQVSPGVNNYYFKSANRFGDTKYVKIPNIRLDEFGIIRHDPIELLTGSVSGLTNWDEAPDAFAPAFYSLLDARERNFDRNGSPNRVSATNSNGDKLIVQGIPAFTQYGDLLTANMLTQQSGQTTYELKSGSSTPRVVAARATTWANTFGGSVWRPAKTYAWKANFNADGTTDKTYADFVHTSGASNPNWVLQGSIDSYNANGRTTQTSDALLVSGATVYSGLNSLPVASVANAKYAECAFYTCDHSPDNGWTLGAGGSMSAVKKHFGDSCVYVNNNWGPTKNVDGFSTAKDYIFSAWVYPLNGNTISLSVEKRIGGTHTGDLGQGFTFALGEQNKWHLRTVKISSSQLAGMNPGADYLRIHVSANPGSGAQFYVDDIRFYPDDALATTSYYDDTLAVPLLTVDANDIPSHRLTYDGYGRVVKEERVDRTKSFGDAGYGAVVATKEYHTMTDPQPGESVRILSPNGGETYQVGQTIHVYFTADPLKLTGAIPQLSKDGGTTWNLCDPDMEEPIYPQDPDYGNYVWTIPAAAASGNCKIRIIDHANSGTVNDASDASFTINP
jgi:hypothetical protein